MECQCGCGQEVPKGNKAFVSKAHQMTWLKAGGARELNALLPDDVRQAGGRTSGRAAADSGRLAEAGLRGAARAAELAAEWHAQNAG